jgi:hypothetical protein
MLVVGKIYINPKCASKQKKQPQNFNLNYLIPFKTKTKTVFFFKIIQKTYNVVLYKVLDLIKLFNSMNIKNYFILFIRKQKTFNKGRYSRNRQIYRTGTY